jgi:hypothetical protein
MMMKIKMLPNILLPLVFGVSSAFAAKMPMPADTPASYEAECANCHMAYPPGLLGETSWKYVMSGRGLVSKVQQTVALAISTPPMASLARKI